MRQLTLLGEASRTVRLGKLRCDRPERIEQQERSDRFRRLRHSGEELLQRCSETAFGRRGAGRKPVISVGRGFVKEDLLR